MCYGNVLHKSLTLAEVKLIKVEGCDSPEEWHLIHIVWRLLFSILISFVVQRPRGEKKTKDVMGQQVEVTNE